MRVWIAIVWLAGCWHGAQVTGPARWNGASLPEVMPAGAWLVGAFDITSDSPGQRALEQKALHDPQALRSKDGGCQIPATHFAIGLYPHSEVAVAAHGVFDRRALLACIAELGRSRGKRVSGGDIIEIRSDEGLFTLTATDTGMLVGASSVPLLTALLAEHTRSATADPALEPLIADARLRGELWIAGLVPRDANLLSDTLAAIGVKPTGRVVSITGAVHLTSPQGIEVVLRLDGARAAHVLARDLEARRRTLRDLVDAGLAPVLDALTITADDDRVRIAGTPKDLDWLKVLGGLVATIGSMPLVR